MKKRFLSMLLCLVMVLGLLPTAAFAVGEEEGTASCNCDTACTAENMNTSCPVCGTAGAEPQQCRKYIAEVSNSSELEAAFNNSTASTIKLKNNFSVGEDTLYLTVNRPITLDLNGKTLGLGSSPYINYNLSLTETTTKVLTVTDSGENGEINFSEKWHLYYVDFILESGTIRGEINFQSGRTHTFTMTGGCLDGGKEEAYHGAATFYADGGEIKSTCCDIWDSGWISGAVYSGYNGTILCGENVSNPTVFNCAVSNDIGGRIEGGIFNGVVCNNHSDSQSAAVIAGGTFNGKVVNRGAETESQTPGQILGGTFCGPVENNGVIKGGTFTNTVTNYGTIYATAKFESSGKIEYETNEGNVVTYKDGGNDYAWQFVQSGGKATAPDTPTREGFSFAGWYNGDTKYDFNTTVTTEDLVLTAKWAINADPESLYFGTAGYGDAAPEAKTVTLTNPSKKDVTVTLPTSTNYTITEGTGFSEGKATLAPNGTATFTVQPKTGLALGNHDEKLTVSGDNDTIVNVPLAFTVKIAQTAPDAPELDSRTKNSITLKEIPDNANGVKAQYRMGDGDWRDSPVFNNLSSGTEYSFTVRYAETESYAASPASEAVTFRTNSGGGGGVSTYNVTVNDSENGTVTADRKTASSGTTITLNVKPDNGWTLETLTVTNQSGKEIDLDIVEIGEKYTFKMPSGSVTVKATFMEDNTMLNYFVDVNAQDYFYDAVLWAAENGVTYGVDDSHFAPNEPCTRAQIVTFLWRAAGSPEPKSLNSFTDVAADSYYAKAVAWAVEKGITYGTGDGKFSPNATCTRAQAVTFRYRASGSPAVSGSIVFDDVADGTYYANAVRWAVSEGITEGTGSNTFSPNSTCTRAQIVTFIWRALAK